MHADLAAERLQRVDLGRAFERHQHADLAQARLHRVVDVGRDGALATRAARLARRIVMFSPMVAIRWVSSSATVSAGVPGIGRGLERLDVVADRQHQVRDLGDEGLEARCGQR